MNNSQILTKKPKIHANLSQGSPEELAELKSLKLMIICSSNKIRVTFPIVTGLCTAAATMWVWSQSEV